MQDGSRRCALQDTHHIFYHLIVPYYGRKYEGECEGASRTNRLNDLDVIFGLDLNIPRPLYLVYSSSIEPWFGPR